MENTNDETAPEFTGSATYSPEDNKLRLYVGRVPREEYLKLKAEGWHALHKQRETGGGDFAAVWTPERLETALSYAGIIEDEDKGPAERAAERAERFAGYREKRSAEATGQADKFDAVPAAHGFQSEARAIRAADRHDRIAGRSVDAWSKAEYWQSRTAGVISNALHLSSPHVRMGRIKTIETDLRGLLSRWEGQTLTERAEAWKTHYELRLAYENQMLEAQGGRAGEMEIEVGGWVIGQRSWHRKHGWKQIHKVNKSNVTGRVVSVTVKMPGDAYGNTNEGFHLANIEIERASPDCYRAPTEEEKAAFMAEQKAAKAKAKAGKTPCPLINPTDEDAERLQSLWNARNKARGEERKASNKYAYIPELEGEPSKILHISQATYSGVSGGTYSRAETVDVLEGGNSPKGWARRNHTGKAVCKVRVTSGESYKAERVIILTDKPQKPLPAAVWAAIEAEAVTA
jgi:hypothetical protein